MAVTLTFIGSTNDTATVEVWHNYSSGSRAYWDYRVSGTSQWLNRGYDLVSSGSFRQFVFTGLQPSTYYEFRVRIVNGSNGAELGSDTAGGATGGGGGDPDPTPTRPSDFSWSVGKFSGYAFNVTASEWNALCAKINEFRSYKKLDAYAFSSASSGQPLTASQFNQARNAINDMSPSISIPDWVASGYPIYASELNRLRDSLNSVS